jgi:hypothetical protein
MKKAARIFLGIIHSILALNAFGGGAYGLLGAKEVPQEWLSGSPFSSYLVPSLFLFFIVGGSCLFTAILLFRDSEKARAMCFVTGTLLLCWIGAQMLIIGYVSWLQPAVALSAIIIISSAFLSREHK